MLVIMMLEVIVTWAMVEFGLILKTNSTGVPCGLSTRTKFIFDKVKTNFQKNLG